MKRILLILTVLLLGVRALTAQAQTAQDPPSSTFGLDEKDAQAVRQIRFQMARIRRHRPTVALVLSGGGAKGAATVGALKYLEEYKIPIDMVVGTSIGGLVGGLYALGYSVDYLDSLFHNMNWDMALSDKVDRSFIPYSRIRYKEKFVLSFPFYYRPDDYKNFLAGDMPFAAGRSRQIHLGAASSRSTADELVRGNLLGSLPSGFVFGQNVNQEITSRTVGYSDSTDFFKLPIPFACVATDMVSGKAKVWHNGSLNLAMRSTMSIPGLFAPVRTGGMVLVDGGMRNNFPVNIARAMGADIIIGIDLSEGNATADEIQNLGDILFSAMDLFSNDAFRRNIETVDLRIHPDMTGYNMLSFNKVAVDTMYQRGYRAAKAMDQDIRALRQRLGNDTFSYQAPKAVDVDRQNVVIGGIDIVGVSPSEAEYIRSMMFVQPGTVVSRKVIEADVATIFGKGAYDYVNYELRGTQEPYRLRILAKRGPMHQLGLGARIDSESLVSLLLNVGLNTHALSGSSLDLTARISTNPYLDVHYAYNAPHFSTFNARAHFRYTDQGTFLTGDNRYNIAFTLATQELFFSNMHWSQFDVKLGLRNQYLKVNRILSQDITGDYDASQTAADYPGTFVEGRVESMDDGYFPTKGVSAGLRGDLLLRSLEKGAPQPLMGIIEADGLMPVTMGRFSLLPQGYLRMVIGTKIPIIYSNVMGGDMRSRYVEQQFPFIGISNAAFRRDHLAIARLDARLRLGKNHFVTAMGNVSYDFEDFAHFEEGEAITGFGLGYSYNSIAGPVKAMAYWNTLTRKVGFYLAFGYNF